MLYVAEHWLAYVKVVFEMYDFEAKSLLWTLNNEQSDRLYEVWRLFLSESNI